MADKASQFLDKLSELSEETQFYFSSKVEARALVEIKSDYRLSEEDLDNLIYDIFIANFDFKVLDDWLKATKISMASQSKLAADILGKIFLPPALYLKLDIKAEIIKRGHRPEVYQKYEDDFNGIMEDRNLVALEELAKFHEATFDPVEEERVALDLFNNGLKNLLNDNDAHALATLNGGLVYLLINKPDFHDKANKALLANSEIVTEKTIVWSEGIERGTVTNWLKDFIKENGSDIYNSVVLSRYLATSANPQSLSEGERKVVRCLLRLYRNLIFFPDSMNDIPMEDWEIVPIEKVSMERPILGFKPKVNEPVVSPVVTEAPVAPIITEIKTPELEKSKKTKENQVFSKIESEVTDSELISLLSQYAPTSLEAKALKEEIKRRQK